MCCNSWQTVGVGEEGVVEGGQAGTHWHSDSPTQTWFIKLEQLQVLKTVLCLWLCILYTQIMLSSYGVIKMKYLIQ